MDLTTFGMAGVDGHYGHLLPGGNSGQTNAACQ